MTMQEATAAPTTLSAVLAERAAQMPNALAYAFLPDGFQEAARLTWSELHDRALGLASALVEHAPRGSRVLLLLLPGLETVIAQQACFAAGVVGVPVALPNPRRKDYGLAQLQRTAVDADIAVVLSARPIADFLAADLPAVPALAKAPWVLVDEAPTTAPSQSIAPPAADDLAYLQYTSGSTSAPRGVMLTHHAMLSNLTAIQDTWQLDERARLYTWVPPWHDMGLVAGILLGAFVGVPTYVAPPLAIARKPLTWLRAITEFGITVTGAPDFMYRMCAAQLNEETRQGLDLSSWSSAYFGSEPVKADTVRAFAEATAPIGLAPEAIITCFGMAESTLLITNSDLHTLPVIRVFDREELGRGRALELPAGTPGGVEMVGNGGPHASQRIAIVDPDSHRRLPDDAVGEVWTTGPSLGIGYWRQPDATDALFHARIEGEDDGMRWLRSGDVGFISEGELYISGRRKDVLISNGIKHHAVDLEGAAQASHPLLTTRAAAAFTQDAEGVGDQIVVVIELPKGDPIDEPAGTELLTAVRRAIANTFDLQPQRIVLVPSGEIPKTTSGKVQRGRCRALLSAGSLPSVQEWTATRKGRAA